MSTKIPMLAWLEGRRRPGAVGVAAGRRQSGGHGRPCRVDSIRRRRTSAAQPHAEVGGTDFAIEGSRGTQRRTYATRAPDLGGASLQGPCQPWTAVVNPNDEGT
jgi:hypothetical protein